MDSNKKLENTAIQEGAMTYGDYIASLGADAVGDMSKAKENADRVFDASVKDAAREHDRAIGTYGQNAENMAQAGMGGSGYSDYITGNAYAVRQGSIDAAKAVREGSLDAAKQTKKLTEQAGQQGYLNYIENYRAQKKADRLSAVSNIINMNLSGEGAKSYLSALGLSDDADTILGITEPMLEKSKSELDETSKQNIFSNVLSNGLTGEAAMSYAKYLGLTDEEAKELVGVTDGILEQMAENEDMITADTITDFSKTGGTLADFANMLYAARNINNKNEREKSQIFIDNHNSSEEEAMYAQTGDAEGLINYWMRTWRSKGYSADEIDAMISLIEDTSAAILKG